MYVQRVERGMLACRGNERVVVYQGPVQQPVSVVGVAERREPGFIRVLRAVVSIPPGRCGRLV